MGTELFFNMQTKISGAMSTVFSKLLSPEKKGEFDTLVLLQQQDHGKKRYVYMHTHTHIHTSIQIYI